jgi:ABC-type multidrug transport system fused ATPase/permease subunit
MRKSSATDERDGVRSTRFKPGFLRSDLGLLFSRGTRIRLIMTLCGLVLVSFLDILGVLAMLPLMGLFTGADTRSGALGVLSGVFGGSLDERELTLLVAGGALLAFILKGAITVAFRWWQLGFLARQQAETAVTLLRAYLRAPYSMHLRRNTSEFIRIIAGAVPESYNFAINGFFAFAAELITLLAVSALLLAVNPLLALTALLYLGIAAGILHWSIRRRVTSMGVDLAHHSQRTVKSMLHALGAVKEVKLRNNPDPFVEVYKESRFGEAYARRGYAFLGELPKYLMEIVFIVGIALLAAGLFLTLAPEEALPMLALFGAAGFRTLPSVVRLIASASGMRFGRAGLGQLIDELRLLNDYGVLNPTAENRAGGQPISGDIRLDDVTFSYEDGRPVLRGVSLDIPRGSSLALVGSSGAGKSTLIDLILGLQAPDAGTITCGGRDIHRSVADWQARVGTVPQDVFLLDASLRQNIVFDVAEADIDPVRLQSAIEKAQLQDLIQDSPLGLDTTVGDRGVRLSGGQRQRIGIARALYLQPEVLILDEATSALDNETERRITQTIESLHGEITLIIVAHRLSTVRRCDSFAVLDQGQVEAYGTFDEVAASSPQFAKMVELASLNSAADLSAARLTCRDA